jgi:hypothetical protein
MHTHILLISSFATQWHFFFHGPDSLYIQPGHKGKRNKELIIHIVREGDGDLLLVRTMWHCVSVPAKQPVLDWERSRSNTSFHSFSLSYAPNLFIILYGAHSEKKKKKC